MRLAIEGGVDGRVGRDVLRHHVSREVKRLKLEGLPMKAKETKRFLVLVDVKAIAKLRSLPVKERSAALAKRLRTIADVDAIQFSRWRGAVANGMRRVGEGLPFSLGIITGILQVVTLVVTADFKNKKTLTEDQREAHMRFLSGVLGVMSSVLDLVETAITDFRLFVDASSRFEILSSKKVLKWIGLGAKLLGAVAGGITVVYDFYHFLDESHKGHIGLVSAYLLSASSGAWLLIVVYFTLPALGTFLALLTILTTAIYLAVNSRDNTQKWLVRTLWRRIPQDTKRTMQKQEHFRRVEEEDLPIWPDFNVEILEFKLAMKLEG